jgi:hypothetical protein
MADSRTAVLAALAGNLALAILKGISAAATGSAAMLAETLHSISDTGNQILLIVGMRLGRRPPSIIRSATARTSTSGRSSCPSCCSRSVAPSPSGKASNKLLHPSEHIVSR